jgi:uncharacterized OB-fold protein
VEGPLSEVAAGAALEGSRCPGCGVVTCPVAEHCPRCGSSTESLVLSSRGRLWTWTVQRHAPKSPPYVAPETGFVPFPVGYVELAEGVRVAAVLDVPPSEVRIGMPLRLSTGPGVPRAAADR